MLFCRLLRRKSGSGARRFKAFVFASSYVATVWPLLFPDGPDQTDSDPVQTGIRPHGSWSMEAFMGLSS